MKKNRKKTPSRKTQKAVSKARKGFTLPLFLRKIIVFTSTVIMLFALYRFNVGYKWFYDHLIVENLKKTYKYLDYSPEQKMELKLGFSSKYMNFLKKETPEDAIIIMPPDSAFHPKGKKNHFNNFITRRTWGHYFVYPRKLVFEKEKDKYPELYKKATHIAVVNHWGYEKLPFKVKKKEEFSIINLTALKTSKK